MTTETALIKCDNERIIEAPATPNAMNAAYTSLLRCGFDTEVANELVKAIAAGCIDNVTLTV